MKLDILAFGVHPDDVELSCAGTLMVEINNGKKVGVIDLTRGELGTRGTAETRREEFPIKTDEQKQSKKSTYVLTEKFISSSFHRPRKRTTNKREKE